MLNQIVLVGRLAGDPELYETDFIYCKLWQGVAKRTYEYCNKGDLIGIKGRVETYNYDTENGKRYITEVVADKVTFLSSKKQGN